MKNPEILGWKVTIDSLGIRYATLPEFRIRELVEYAKWAEGQLKDPDRPNTRLIRTRIENKITEIKRELTAAIHLMTTNSDCKDKETQGMLKGLELDMSACRRAIVELKEVVSWMNLVYRHTS